VASDSILSSSSIPMTTRACGTRRLMKSPSFAISSGNAIGTCCRLRPPPVPRSATGSAAVADQLVDMVRW
jgi:hypothetical protein